jgi:hypothetical protein
MKTLLKSALNGIECGRTTGVETSLSQSPQMCTKSHVRIWASVLLGVKRYE